MSPRRPQEGQNEPKEGAKGTQGPPKGTPKSPQERTKIAAPKSIVIYGVSSWKIAFSLGLAAFLKQFHRPNRCFLASRARKHRILRGRGGQNSQKTKIRVFARRAVLQDVSRFLGGRGLAKSRKIAFSLGRCCKNSRKKRFFEMLAPPGPKSS